jgi:aerobic carbon-monoxide dehydrogenase small subunit
VTTREIALRVNGVVSQVMVEPRTTLADALRDGLGLHGTHLGCEQGVCGSCTVLLDGAPVRSCLLFALQCEDKSVTTIEGLADGGSLHPLQRAFIDHSGLQCGFCTPGFIMLAVGALDQDPDLDEDELVELLSSNLCRCTGYRNILDAVKQGAEDMRVRGSEPAAP